MATSLKRETPPFFYAAAKAATSSSRHAKPIKLASSKVFAMLKKLASTEVFAKPINQQKQNQALLRPRRRAACLRPAKRNIGSHHAIGRANI